MSTNRDSNGKLAKRLVDLAAVREGILRSIGRESGGSLSSRPAGDDKKCHGRRTTPADRAKIRRLRRRGVHWHEIAIKVGWSVAACIRAFRSGRRLVTEQDRDEIRFLRGQGLTVKQIAKQVCLSARSVAYALSARA